jgi:glycosyltransferase involved in cell wall biosynthesis
VKKILIIHNKYRNEGGEDIAVSKEIELLKKYFDVRVIIYKNKIKSIFEILSLIFLTNYSLNKEILNTVDKFNPDIVYFNNTWFRVSLGIFKKLIANKSKILIKLHNFRYDCTKSLLSARHLNGAEFCPACGFSKYKLHSFNKYFKESYLKSLYAIYFNRKYIKILQNNKISIAVLTEFHKNFLYRMHGIKDNVYVIPNFINGIELQKNNSDYLIYAGRISNEKGVRELIEAFLNSKFNMHRLKILGIGPALEELKKRFPQENIMFLGQLPNKETVNLISNSLGVLSATKLYEGQPTLLCEALLSEIPCIFPNSGGIAEFLPTTYPLTFKQYDYDDLLAKINFLYDKNEKNEYLLEGKQHIQKKLDKSFIVNKYTEIIKNDI